MDVATSSSSPTAADSPAVESKAAEMAEPAALLLAVREFIIAHTKPADLPEGWGFLPTHETIRQHIMQSFEFALLLDREFGAAPLEALGIFGAKQFATMPILHRVLESERFVMEPYAPNAPMLIYDAMGAIFDADPPAMVLGAARSEQNAVDTTPMLIAQSESDLQLLRGMGYPAVPLTGLPSINIKHEHKLFGHDMPGRAPRPRFIIVGFNLTDLKRAITNETREFLRRLAVVQQRYGVDPGTRFTFWAPCGTTLKWLRDFVDFADPERVRRLVQESLPEPELDMSWRYHVKLAPVTYYKLRSDLQSLVRDSGRKPPVDKISEKLVQLKKFYKRHIVSRAYDLSASANSPLDEITCMARGGLIERFLQADPLVQAAQKIVAGELPDPESETANLEEQVRIVDRLLRWRRYDS